MGNRIQYCLTKNRKEYCKSRMGHWIETAVGWSPVSEEDGGGLMMMIL